MISHRNVIANTMQIATFDKPYRDTLNDPASKYDYQENCLGLLPMSHIYGLVVICHASLYQGDGVIVLPKFEFASTMQAIQDYKINTLFLVILSPASNTSTRFPPPSLTPTPFPHYRSLQSSSS